MEVKEKVTEGDAKEIIPRWISRGFLRINATWDGGITCNGQT
jgi:hypothetical protein